MGELTSNVDFISKSGEKFPWQDIRLPLFVSPIEYALHLEPDLVAFGNTGNVKITFALTSETDFIVLHSKDLTLVQTKLFNDGKEVSVVKVLEYIKYEQLYIKSNEILKPGSNYVLCIDFKNTLEEKLEGFYLSSYKTSDGRKRYLATTHFEPTHARSAFPCFDEPAKKAEFTLTIVHKDEHKVYFNTEIKKSSPHGDGLTLTEFEKSVQMSTYLVAFVVCDFEEIECISSNGIKIRVITPAEQLPDAKYALSFACNVLPFYEKFFGVKYPLSKLDMIAIPDFGAGAMENWGLITYRMVSVMFNQVETSCSAQERVAITIAHELAHQWFGNLVTMSWWNDLWLNEGFANFVEYLGVDFVHPEWNVMSQFVVQVTQDALVLDSLETSHPIMTEVKDPFDIESIFDQISYTKGAALIYMLQNALGMECLKEGLSLYLNEYRFKNAKTEDLWNAFTSVTEAQQVNVAKIMDTWTLQKGFPLVYVKYQNGLVKIHQERFLLAPPADDSELLPSDVSPFNYKWHIPISYVTDKDKNKKMFWLDATEGEFSISPDISWLKVNVNQSGFYRVMYDEEMWKILIKQILTDHTVFSAADRACLLDDVFTLARIGILKGDFALDLSKYLINEQDHVPWEAAIAHFGYLYQMLQDSTALPLFEKYAATLLKPLVQSLGWKDEGDHSTKKLRATVLGASMKYNDEDTVRETKNLFNRWMNNGESISPNLRRVIYFAGIRNGGEKEWQFCWDKYQVTQIPSEKQLLLAALSQTRNHWQLSQYLSYSLDKNKIRPQDTAHSIAYTSQNSIGRLLTWRFVRMHWQKLLAMFGHGFGMETIITYSICNFSTKFDFDEVKSFFSKVETGAGVRAVQQGLEKIRANIQWKNNTESSIIQWLQRNVTNT